MADGDVLQIVAGHQEFGPGVPIEFRDENDVLRASITNSPDTEGFAIRVFDALEAEISSVGIAPDGAVSVSSPFGTMTVTSAGAALETPNGGIVIEPDGTTTILGIVTLRPDFTYELNGAQFIEATAAGLDLHLPTADPEVNGVMYSEGAPAPGVPVAVMVSGGPP